MRQAQQNKQIEIHHWFTSENELQFIPKYLVSDFKDLHNLQSIFFDALDDLIAELEGHNKYQEIDTKKQGSFTAALKKAKGRGNRQ